MLSTPGKSDVFKTGSNLGAQGNAVVQDSLHGKRLSALKQEKFNGDYDKGKTPNSHKIQKLQMSNVKQVSNMVSLSNQTSTEHSKQS